MTTLESDVREEPIYPALWRPRLWFGCHQLPLALVGFFCLLMVPVGLLTQNMWWMGFGGVLMLIAVPLLRFLARFDPHFFQVMPRYLRYARQFPAIGNVHASYPASRRHQR